MTKPFVWVVLALLISFFIKNIVWKKRLRIGAMVTFFLFSNTVVFSEFVRHWEVPGVTLEEVGEYEVGIVLTGMAVYNNDLNRLALRNNGDRIWQALNLYHLGKIKKILITGDDGFLDERGLHEADQLSAVLQTWGIPQRDVIVENASRNTYENALFTAKLIRTHYPHFEKGLLITSSIHMKRSLACFEKQGLNLQPFSTDHFTGPKHDYYLDQYIVPDVATMWHWEQLIKEWVGFAMYALKGYL